VSILLTIVPASTLVLIIINYLHFHLTVLGRVLIQYDDVYQEVLYVLCQIVCRGTDSLILNLGSGWNLSASRPGCFD
jgi:hypothetical protein